MRRGGEGAPGPQAPRPPSTRPRFWIRREKGLGKLVKTPCPDYVWGCGLRVRLVRRVGAEPTNSNCFCLSAWLGKGSWPWYRRLMKWASRWFWRLREAWRGRPCRVKAMNQPSCRAFWKAV